MTPRILLLSVGSHWYSTARLPGMLARAGFDVGVLCDSDNLAGQSRHVSRRYALDAPALYRGDIGLVLEALDAFRPGLIVPCDDDSVRILHGLVEAKGLRDRDWLRRTVERSLSRRGRDGHGDDRVATLDLAASLGIACPAHARIHGLGNILAFAGLEGWPAYLKSDHTYGGGGVRFISDRATASNAYRDLTRGHHLGPVYGLLRGLRRGYEAMRGRHNPLALPIGARSISIERAVEGRPAYYVGVALAGQVLAGFGAEVLAYDPPNGPSTRVRLHHDEVMGIAAKRMVETLGYAGFFGLDFIRRADGGLVFLEFNGRPTAANHLGHLVSADLGRALYAAESKTAQPAEPPVSEGIDVAFFPQDWIRAPAAKDRQAFVLDIPVDDPPLLEALKIHLPPGVDKSELDALSNKALRGDIG